MPMSAPTQTPLCNPFALVHRKAAAARMRLFDLGSNQVDFRVAQARAHRMCLEKLTQDYVPGVHDHEPAKVDGFLTRAEAVLDFIEREVPVLLPLQFRSSDAGSAGVIGEYNPLFHELAYQRLNTDTAPAIKDALCVLMTAYAARGYLTGVPRVGALSTDTGLHYALASGQIPLVDARYLEESISAGNAYFAAAFISAGADWTQVPQREVAIYQRGAGQDDGSVIAAGDWKRLIRHCIQAPAEAGHLMEVIEAQTRERIALGMGLTMAAARVRTAAEEAVILGHRHQAKPSAPQTMQDTPTGAAGPSPRRRGL